jgi:hypothetical protein
VAPTKRPILDPPNDSSNYDIVTPYARPFTVRGKKVKLSDPVPRDRHQRFAPLSTKPSPPGRSDGH